MQNLRTNDRSRLETGDAPGSGRRSRLQALVIQWQRADNSNPIRTQTQITEILRLCEPMVRQFFGQMLAEGSLGELDDLVNLTLCRVESKLATYDASRSSFEGWLKYQCVRPVFKQHLEEIGYRTVRLDAYLAALQARLAGQPVSESNLAGRLVVGLSEAQVRPELARTRQLLDGGRKVLLRRDPRLVPAVSLNCPIRPGSGKEEMIDLAATPARPAIEDACRDTLHRSLTALTAGERMVILGLFFENRSRKELAEEAGVSAARVSQLLNQAYRRLRGVLGAAFFRDCVPEE